MTGESSLTLNTARALAQFFVLAFYLALTGYGVGLLISNAERAH